MTPESRCARRATIPAGSKRSSFSGAPRARAVPVVRLAFVVEPRTDFDRLYDAAYYRGEGADPLVDYETEMADPDTVRTYEWSGIVEVVRNLTTLTPQSRWLDFGCGLGGLVRHGRSLGIQVFGHDEGYPAGRIREAGIRPGREPSTPPRSPPRPTASTWSPPSRCSST